MQLTQFEGRVDALTKPQRAATRDSGVSGSDLQYAFSYEVASWMTRRLRNNVAIDWSEIEDYTRLDELLELVLLPVDGEYFDSGFVSGREWLDIARSHSNMSDFDWLMAQLRGVGHTAIIAQLYNSLDLPLAWSIRNKNYSKSDNVLPVTRVFPRHKGMRKPVARVKAEIIRPIPGLKMLSPLAGAEIIDVAMASLAVRHRETYHFNFANPHEIYVANVGKGIEIAVFGLQPQYRFPLECTMGYLILSHGMPIGYGGSSAVFRQVNTGLNIFDEYRGSEAAFLWVQVMRVYHQLVGCTRFVANPYQIGHDNDEALKSGAFWFYYKLGYRPVAADIRKLATVEWKKIAKDRSYRCDVRKLRELSSCDMHLVLGGARASDLFEERWLETSSLLATRQLAAAGCKTHAGSSRKVARTVAQDLGLRSLAEWTADERRAFENIAPILAAVSPADWSADSRRSMRTLLKEKGGPREARFARRISAHEQFLDRLRKRCRQEDSSPTNDGPFL